MPRNPFPNSVHRAAPVSLEKICNISQTGLNNMGTALYYETFEGIYYIKKKIHKDDVKKGWFQREVEIADSLRGHRNVRSSNS